MISTIHFRRILRITSPLTSLLHPLIRLKIASWIKIPGLQTLLDPNSIRGYAKLRTKAYFKEITFEDDTKLVVDLNDIIGFRSALKGTWDPTCLKIAKKIGFENLIFVDIGANIGATSVAIAKQNSRVIAFEANLATASILLKNYSNNAAKYTIVFAFALGSPSMDNEWTQIFTPIGNTGAASLKAKWSDGKTTSSSQNCLITTLDKSLNFLGIFDKSPLSAEIMIIKIDVEGLEDQVFQGGERTISRFRPIIIFENNSEPKKRENPEYFWEKWEGYNLFAISQDLKLTEFIPLQRGENCIALPSTKYEIYFKK